MRTITDPESLDPMTHVLRRESLNDRLFAVLSRERNVGGEVVVLMIDLDCFQEVNAAFGRFASDRALCTVVARIQRVLRPENVLARYGDDEFVVIDVGAESAGPWHLAERVRRAVEGLQMSARGRVVRITASIGVVSSSEIDPSDDPVAALLASSHARMTEAKALGRNCVCTSDPTHESSRKLHSGTRPRAPVAGRRPAGAGRA
jgi:diguanylate cyclase (GGDEF)-like protein